MSFKQLVRFTNSANGLEKILRFLQSLSQILAALAFTVENAVFWMHLRRQFALGRRYFRFFKFLACFSKAYESFLNRLGLAAALEVGKWSCMGAYLFLESLTILDAVGVLPTPWAETCMLEANRFWFFSLVASIMKGVLEYVGWLSRDVGNQHVNHKARKRTAKMISTADYTKIKRGFVTDCFDLAIPGHVTGWIPSSLAAVGFASAMSSLLASKDIWDDFE